MLQACLANVTLGILKAFHLDAYAVLDLQPGVPESDIKRTYRSKSLLIHPDKTSNPNAAVAFDRLKKAQTALMDEKARARLDESIADARMLLLRERKWTVDHPDLQTEEFKRDWRAKTVEVLIDDEETLRRRQRAQMREEGRQQRKEEEEMSERKRKWQEERDWEATREERVGSWRNFQQKAAGGAQDGGRREKAEVNGVRESGVKADGPPAKKKIKKPKIKTLG